MHYSLPIVLRFTICVVSHHKRIRDVTFTKSEDDEHRRPKTQYTRVMRIDIKEKQRRSLFRKKAACGGFAENFAECMQRHRLLQLRAIFQAKAAR